MIISTVIVAKLSVFALTIRKEASVTRNDGIVRISHGNFVNVVLEFSKPSGFRKGSA